MKKFALLFRTLNDDTKGYLGIKGHYISVDKQQHIVLALLTFSPIYFLTLQYGKLSDIITVFVSTVVMFVFGMIIELFQKITGSGKFDFADALVMAITHFVFSFFWVLIRSIFYH